MNRLTIDSIEREIRLLPREERLRLVERLADQLRGAAEREALSSGWIASLEAMAADSDTLRECAAIGREFGSAELDGLGAK